MSEDAEISVSSNSRRIGRCSCCFGTMQRQNRTESSPGPEGGYAEPEFLQRNAAQSRSVLHWVLQQRPKVFSQEPSAVADVVVVVDSSASMSHPGMDPERTSLLVTKLFADIVPGNLAAIRSMDLSSDRALLPSRDTGRSVPCSEDHSATCHQVDPSGDWYRDARSRKLGALVRRARADPGFKSALADHLEQMVQNSLFGLGFRAAEGIFDSHGPPREDVPRVAVWLSDGETDDPQELSAVVNEMKGAGVVVVPIIFGRGNPETSRQIGLSPQQVRKPRGTGEGFRRRISNDCRGTLRGGSRGGRRALIRDEERCRRGLGDCLWRRHIRRRED